MEWRGEDKAEYHSDEKTIKGIVSNVVYQLWATDKAILMCSRGTVWAAFAIWDQ